MSNQNQHNREWGYEVPIPTVTPSGQQVTVQRSERGGRHLMHAETEDQSEFYFEVCAYDRVLAHGPLAEEQRRFISEHALSRHPGECTPATFGHLQGTTFAFEGELQGKLKKRVFLFVEGPNRTYRLVHDPRSSLNPAALAAFHFLD